MGTGSGTAIGIAGIALGLVGAKKDARCWSGIDMGIGTGILAHGLTLTSPPAPITRGVGGPELHSLGLQSFGLELGEDHVEVEDEGGGGDRLCCC